MDRELYQRYIEGDPGAMNAIIERFSAPLTYFINAYVHDTVATEDLLEEVFLVLLVKHRRLKDEGALQSYLFSTARNKSLRYLKRQQRLVPIENAESVPFDMDAEAMALREERKEAVRDALRALPSDYRAVLYLLFYRDMSYEEIAGVMGKSNKQVNNLVYRAKNAMRTLLTKEGFGEND